jgi:hypothetical protein
LGIVSLVVVGLGLQQAHKYITGLLEVELVEPPMLAAEAMKPCPFGALDKCTSLASDL